MLRLHRPTHWSTMSNIRWMLGSLVLMFSLCDAERDCSTVVITVNQVVAEFGKPAMLNCTVDLVDQDVFLKIGTEEKEVESEILLTNWHMQPECIVPISDSLQCSKEFDIVLYKIPDSVSVSADVMTEGAKTSLSCHVVNVAPLKALRVKWYKNNETMHTEMFTGTNVGPLNIISTLKIMARREDNGAYFRCEAQLHLGPNGPERVPTVTSSPYTAVVHYKPTIQQCPDEHTGVERVFRLDSLPCGFDGNPQPTVRWYYKGTEIDPSLPLTRNDSGLYTAEAENKLGKSDASIKVTVEYAPVFNGSLVSFSVYKGENVHLSCDADAHPQPHLNWTCDGMHNTETTNDVYLRQIQHDTTCKCTASNYLNSATKEFNISALELITTAPPAATTIYEATTQYECPGILSPAEVVVRFGDPLLINCSTSAADAKQINFSVSIGRIQPVEPLFVSWVVNKVKKWNVRAKCSVTLGRDQCFEIPRVTVYKIPDSVSFTADVMTAGAETSLNCRVINVAPLEALRLKWYKNNETIHTSMFNASVGLVNVRATLKIIARRKDDGAYFRCEAQLHLGPNGPERVPTVTSSPYTAVVHYKPTIQQCPDEHTGVERVFRLDSLPCGFDGNPQPAVRWYYKGTEIDPSLPLTRNDSGVYTAEAENKLGKSNASIKVTVEYKPTFQKCPDEHAGGERVFRLDSLPCGFDGNPQPAVRWYYKGTEIDPSVPLTRNDSGVYTAEAENKLGKSNASIKVTVEYGPSFTCPQRYEIVEGAEFQSACEADGVPRPDITWTKDGTPIPSPPRWTKHDSGTYTLRAINNHGADSQELYLDVLYGPVFNWENYTQKLDPGENVTLECSAEGNPPPEVYWEYAPAGNTMVTTGGRQKNIRITGATSTNARVYVCVAKSKVGHVTRSVTLLMRGKSQVPMEVYWVFPLLIFLIILLLVWLILYCKKKQRKYSFVPDRPNDGSDGSLPLTTKNKGAQC